jgi:hypothetical protein
MMLVRHLSLLTYVIALYDLYELRSETLLVSPFRIASEEYKRDLFADDS